MVEPAWLVGDDVTPIADGITVWLFEMTPAMVARWEGIGGLPGEVADFARHPDAAERLVRRRLARSLLAAAAGCAAGTVVIARTGDGAPIVRAPVGWHLSVAARWPATAIAIAPVAIGVDIEAVGEPLPPDLLHPAERGMPPDPRAHAALWAAKEAHAKWTGRPRALDPATIDAAMADRVTSPLGATRCWRRDWGEHVVAVCAA